MNELDKKRGVNIDPRLSLLNLYSLIIIKIIEEEQYQIDCDYEVPKGYTITEKIAYRLIESREKGIKEDFEFIDFLIEKMPNKLNYHNYKESSKELIKFTLTFLNKEKEKLLNYEKALNEFKKSTIKRLKYESDDLNYSCRFLSILDKCNKEKICFNYTEDLYMSNFVKEVRAFPLEIKYPDDFPRYLSNLVMNDINLNKTTTELSKCLRNK